MDLIGLSQHYEKLLKEYAAGDADEMGRYMKSATKYFTAAQTSAKLLQMGVVSMLVSQRSSLLTVSPLCRPFIPKLFAKD